MVGGVGSRIGGLPGREIPSTSAASAAGIMR